MFMEITPEWANTMGNPRLAETYNNLFDDLTAGRVSEEDRHAVEISIGVLIGAILQRFVCMYCDLNDAPTPEFTRKPKEDLQ